MQSAYFTVPANWTGIKEEWGDIYEKRKKQCDIKKESNEIFLGYVADLSLNFFFDRLPILSNHVLLFRNS